MKSSASQSCIRLSINAAPGSGCHAEYLSHLLFSLEANKSTVGSPRILQMASNISIRSVHSVLSSNIREASSASTFSIPGQYAALSHMLWDYANSQICLVMSLHVTDWVEPCLLIQALAVVLSVMTRMWDPSLFFVKLCSPSKIAFSSR